MLLYAAISKISCLLENVSPINLGFRQIASVTARSGGRRVTLLRCRGRKHRETFAFERQNFWEDLGLHFLQQQVSGCEGFVCKSFLHLCLCRAIAKWKFCVQLRLVLRPSPLPLQPLLGCVYTTSSTAIPTLKWCIFLLALDPFFCPEPGWCLSCLPREV